MGNILEQIIAQEYNHTPLFFHGSLNVKQREEMIKKFKDEINEKIMILSHYLLKFEGYNNIKNWWRVFR